MSMNRLINILAAFFIIFVVSGCSNEVAERCVNPDELTGVELGELVGAEVRRRYENSEQYEIDQELLGPE